MEKHILNLKNHGNRLLLKFFDINRNHKVVVRYNASEIDIGRCLEQENENNEVYPVAFYSRKLSDGELTFSIGEKEELTCLEPFRIFLLDRPFNLGT